MGIDPTKREQGDPRLSDARSTEVDMALCSFNDPHGKSDKARQFLLDRACERKHPKRHRTQKRAKRINAEKRRKAAAKLELQHAARSKFLAKARAYWRGEIDNHP